MQVRPRRLTSVVTFSTNLWMTRSASSIRLSMKSGVEPPLSAMLERLPAAAAVVTVVGGVLPSPVRARGIFVPSVARLRMARPVSLGIARIAALSVPAAAHLIVESMRVMTMTSSRDDCDELRSKRQILSSKKSFGRNIKTTSAMPKVVDSGDERS